MAFSRPTATNVLRSWTHGRLRHPALEDVLSDREAERNATDVLREVDLSVFDQEGIELPVNAQPDPAATVLDDHLPQAVREVADVSWSHRSLVVFVDAVVFVGHEFEAVEQLVRFPVLFIYAVKEPRDVE